MSEELIDRGTNWQCCALTAEGDVRTPAEVLTRVGELLQALSRVEDAIVYYRASMQLDPKYALAPYRLGYAYVALNRYWEAVEAFQLAIESTTHHHAPTHYAIGTVYAALGQHERALDSLQEALRYDPKHTGARLEKMRSFAALQRWDELRDACVELHRIVPDVQEVKIWHALAEMNLGNFDAARDLYRNVGQKVRNRYRQLSIELEKRLGTD